MDKPADFLAGKQPLSPSYFFNFHLTCSKWNRGFEKKHLLPALCKLDGKSPFATVSIGWEQEGLHVQVEVLQDEIKVFYPDIQKGDSIELFIDTKNLKSAKTSHSFCHHFFFLPEPIEGIDRGEITRFRTEDTHPLCMKEDLECTIEHTKKGYTASIFIPERCLTGFQGEKNTKIGFGYRVNSSIELPQLFAIPKDTMVAEQYPYLLAEMQFVE